MQRHIKLNRFYKHPPEKVWKALTNPKALAAWFAENDFQPVVGHKFYFRTDASGNFDGFLYCEVLQVDEPRKLVYTFKGGSMKSLTTVTWLLTPQNGGTHLRLEHTGFAGLGDILVSGILQYGWFRFLRNMPHVLDTIEEIMQ